MPKISFTCDTRAAVAAVQALPPTATTDEARTAVMAALIITIDPPAAGAAC